jgi:hypothetical protein
MLPIEWFYHFFNVCIADVIIVIIISGFSDGSCRRLIYKSLVEEIGAISERWEEGGKCWSVYVPEWSDSIFGVSLRSTTVVVGNTCFRKSAIVFVCLFRSTAASRSFVRNLTHSSYGVLRFFLFILYKSLISISLLRQRPFSRHFNFGRWSRRRIRAYIKVIGWYEVHFM